MLQNIFNFLIIFILIIQFQGERAHDRQLRALFYITDTLQDLLLELINRTKEKENEEENTL